MAQKRDFAELEFDDDDEELPCVLKKNPKLDLIPLNENETCVVRILESNQLASIKDTNMLSSIMTLAFKRPEFAAQIFSEIGVRGLPILPKFNLFDHQLEALKWMRYREENPSQGMAGGILCMKMGMGKTLTALAHVLTRPRTLFPTLVVCSKTVLTEWMSQGKDKFFIKDMVKFLIIHKDFTDLESLHRHSLQNIDVVLTTYDTLMIAQKKVDTVSSLLEYNPNGSVATIHCQRSFEAANKPHLLGVGILYGTPWDRVICDESQRFANPESVIFKSVMALHGRFKWCLTGTPIRNYETDIWSQFRFLGYRDVTRAQEWKRNGLRLFQVQGLSRYIHNVSYESAGVELAPCEDIIVEVDMHDMQKQVYETILKQTQDMMRIGIADFACILAMFTRLRQCALAPYLISVPCKKAKVFVSGKLDDDDDDEIDVGGSFLDRATISNSKLVHFVKSREEEAGLQNPKFLQTIRILEETKGEKVVIFSMFSSVLDLLSEALDSKGIQNLVIDGSTSSANRLDIIKNFKENPDMKALLLTYKVGGEGLNLTEANNCIFMEPWWSDAVHQQAKARVWRTGQEKHVKVFWLVCNLTIEKAILDICKEKIEMSKAYLDDKPVSKGRGMGMDRASLAKILQIYEH